MNSAAFLPDSERRIYDGVVHQLRSRGWSRIDAEGEALDRIERMRARTANEQARANA
jgi:hypothetical protein